MRHDMTKAQFDAACKRRGFRREFGAFGYYALPDVPVSVSILNAGPTRREQLAYLIREHERALRKYGKD